MSTWQWLTAPGLSPGMTLVIEDRIVTQQASRGDRLRILANELTTLADAVDQPSRTIARANMLIAEGERIASAVWSAFRGGR